MAQELIMKRISELVAAMSEAKTEEEYNALRRQWAMERDNLMREQGIDPVTHKYIR